MTGFKLDSPVAVVLVLDQMSVYLRCRLCRVWSPVGQIPIVRNAPQRDSLKFYSALNGESGVAFALTLPTMIGATLGHD